jgi:four helix bundle protein
MDENSLADYAGWERRVPESVTSDSLWKVSVYRKALYLRFKAWSEAMKILRHGLGGSLARQLYRAVGSIGANISEGWSRSTGLERAHAFDYSLGSTREAIVWYLPAAEILGPTVTKRRLSQLAEVRRLLLVMIQTERRRRGRVAKASLAKASDEREKQSRRDEQSN